MYEWYLISLRKQFDYYKSLGDKTFEQLEEAQLFQDLSAESNSIAVIVKHLKGNMLSRFTNFLEEDGEKEWRQRDQEFETTYTEKHEILDAWEVGWNCVFNALDTVKDIHQIVYIRKQKHSVYEALNRQLAHYAYHVGQIVFIGKVLKGENWRSLSIPRGKSIEYNQSKLDLGEREGHYTDDFLDKKN